MKTISCIIVDDEPLAVKLMESYAAKTPFLSLLGSFTSGTAAYSFLQDTPVDLLFCDIQMPNLSGMELSKMLPPRTRIIFTTAFSEYAVEGFRVRALDYLLKPISYDDFLAAALNAKEYFEAPGDSAGRPKSIFVKTEYRLQLKDYVKIHLCGESSPILSLMRLKTLEETLPRQCFRPSQQILHRPHRQDRSHRAQPHPPLPRPHPDRRHLSVIPLRRPLRHRPPAKTVRH